MSSERFARLKEIVLAARELPAADRAAYLEQAAAGDAALLAEALDLLARDADSAELIRSRALAGQLGEALAASLIGDDAGLPERIGPYRVLERLGEGGMGVVYRAEQTEPIRREVAIKVVRRGLDTERVVARFQSERQTLARMEHPGIARVLDAGADPGGPPYVVMELVRGEPITRFCDRMRFTTGQRIELFLQVCEAVQHAHHKGVLHRDLKPSNILVGMQDGRPAPKVIDFGIAKALEDPGGEAALLTQQGQLVGTPEYMSPEQAGVIEGGVDTRTDVYSLGVLLYELLTGHRPYRFPSERPADILRVIAEEEPGRPSTALTMERGEDGAPVHRRGTDTAIPEARSTSAARLRRQLAGDLDNIVLMALRKQPARRYSSVEHLAEDLRRWQGGLPVHARRDSLGYRAGKFARRHRLAASLAAAIVLGLAGIAVTLAVQSARLTRERDRARAAEVRARTEAESASQVADFIGGLFWGANPRENLGEALTARQLLERGHSRIDSLEATPEVKARLFNTLAEVYHTLGEYDDARTLAEKALAAARPALGADHAETAQALELLGIIEHDAGNLEISERHAREALDMNRRLHEGDHENVARSLMNLAVSVEAAGNLDGAEPIHREAIEMNRRLFGERNVEVAFGEYSLGWVLHQKNRYAAAESLYRQALDTQIALLGQKHPDIGATLNNLAGVRWHRGDWPEAEKHWRHALEVYRAVYPENHPAVPRAMFNLARVLRVRGGAAEAERLYRVSLAMTDTLLGRDHPAYSTHLVGLAVGCHDVGRTRESERLFRDALARRVARGGTGTVLVATVDEGLGLLLADMGRAREALPMLRRALETRRAKQPEGHPDRALPMVALGRALTLASEPAAAEPVLREALSVRKAVLDAGHPLIAEIEAALGVALGAQGRDREAEPLLLAGHAGSPEGARGRREAAAGLAALYRRAGREAEAARYEPIAALQAR